VIESQTLLYRTSILFRTKCIDGITVNEKTLQHYMETTVGIVTALNPVLGYEKATELAAEAYKTGKGIIEIIRKRKFLPNNRFRSVGSGQADRARSVTVCKTVEITQEVLL